MEPLSEAPLASGRLSVTASVRRYWSDVSKSGTFGFLLATSRESLQNRSGRTPPISLFHKMTSARERRPLLLGERGLRALSLFGTRTPIGRSPGSRVSPAGTRHRPPRATASAFLLHGEGAESPS